MDQELIARAQAEFGLSYQVTYASHAQNIIGLKGKRVLEVGGSLPERLCLDYLGAEQWICIDEPSYWTEIVRREEEGAASERLVRCAEIGDVESYEALDRHAILRGRVEDVPECLSGRFDAIFSIAAFEHISNLGYALERMYRALRPGGALFTMFSPIWSAFDGHHLPDITDERGRVFGFGRSPIPPWGHLTMRPPQMYRFLLDHTDARTAGEMVYYVYHSPHINRLFVEDYAAYIQASPFQVERFDLTFPMAESPETIEAVRRRLTALHPGREHFINNGILAVLRRPA